THQTRPCWTRGRSMTTLGKILVFLVFLAALALGGLMIYVAKTTPQWKEAVEKRDDVIKILKANADAEAEARKKWVAEYEKMKQLLDAQAIESRAAIERLELQKKDNENQLKTAKIQMDEANINQKKAQNEAERLKK